MPNLRPQELLIILVIVLILFGGSKLPELARNLGRAQKEFRDGIDDGKGGSSKSDSPVDDADVLKAERDALAAEREAVRAEREALKAEKDAES
ncbi:MAG: twin-arginine translocase TatA/TatE family subunit [Acidimicrobiales bacterium]